MNSMLVFKITLEDLGNNVFLSPRVPINTCKGEDTVIERIPVCLTLPSCIRALELTSMITKDNPELKVYVYVSEVPMEYLEDPNKHEIKVPDRWITGELWVTHPWTFIKLSSATIRKHMEIPYSAYSRYAFTMENFDEVLKMLEKGEKKAREIARETIARVKNAVGVVQIALIFQEIFCGIYFKFKIIRNISLFN